MILTILGPGCEITDYDFFGLHNHDPEIVVYNYLEDGFLTFKGYSQVWDTAGVLIEVEGFTWYNYHEGIDIGWPLLYGQHKRFYVEAERKRWDSSGRFWLYMSKDSILVSSDTIRVLISDTVRLHIKMGHRNKHTTVIFE